MKNLKRIISLSVAAIMIFTFMIPCFAASEKVNSVALSESVAAIPATGGRGVILIYVFGSLMLIGAIVLLIAKKRAA